MIETLITSVTASGVISGVTIWLTKSWISEHLSQSIRHEYNEKITAFQTKLKAEADVTIEKLRSDLQIEAAKRNVEHSRIHERRLEIISELAGKLDAFHQKVTAYVSMFEWDNGPTKEEQRKTAAEALSQFNDYFRPRRLFLPEQTVQKIDAFKQGLYSISVEFMLYVEQQGDFERNPAKEGEIWVKASEYTEEKAPALLRELEHDFRSLLGVKH